MLLSPLEFRGFIRAHSHEPGFGEDFETTGFNVHKGDRAFIVAVSFGVNKTASCWTLEKDWQVEEALLDLHSRRYARMAAHNAKFELSFLRHQFNIEVLNKIWCTETMERVRRNNHMSYSLQNCAMREGHTKYQPMLDWLKLKGNKGKYSKAPPELIIPYVEQDAWLSWFLMQKEIEQFKHWDTATPVPVKSVVELEIRTTPMLFDIESRGISVDADYCREALAYEAARAKKAQEEFKQVTGVDFVDSRKTLEPLFVHFGLPFGRTGIGNASFTAKVLGPHAEHRMVKPILDYRDAKKRLSSYWENFLEFRCPDGKVHPNIKQTGATTSRMSVTDPAAQTWTDDDTDPGETPVPFPIRRAFVPTDPDCFIVSIDWRQMEIVLMMDEADETERIVEFKQGADFHQRVADRAGCKRGKAKNGRFAKQYGAGVPRIAETIGVSIDIAQAISDAIDETFPKCAAYSWQLIKHAKQTGMSYNWLGRRYFFDRGFEYKAPNYRIQGGCGEILRIAMCETDDFLKLNARAQTRILMLIHDEGVFQWHKDDLHLIPVVCDLMVKAFKSKKHLDMEVAVTIGKNFFDLEPFKLEVA